MATGTERPDAPAATGAASLAGTALLIRLILRRDRLWLPVWLLLTFGIVTARAYTMADTYPTLQARQARFEEVMVEVPMYQLFQGPAYATSIHALTVQESIAGATILAALGAVLLLVRHTRGEEQTGRRELVGSTAVGRHAPLAAALAVVLGAGVVLAVLSLVGLVGAQMPLAGSLAFALVVASAVWIAAALAAVTAQLAHSAPAAGTAAFALFMGLHFTRGVSDMGGAGLTWLGWLVPNGWLQRARPYADERWWVFLLVLAFVVGLLWVAFTLCARRDLGSAWVSQRPGPATAAKSLRGPIGLAWRSHRAMALVWILASAAICLPTGFVGAEAMGQYATSERMGQWAAAMGSTNPADAFFAYIAFTMVFPITLYAIMTVLRLGAEERGGHAEILLSTPTSRTRWALSHLLPALAVPAALETVVGLGFGLGSGEVGTMLATTTALVPAIWVMVAIAMAAHGLAGRGAAIIGYGALVVALTMEFGQHLGWPAWLFATFSPFAHVLPFYGPPSAATLLVLTLIAGLLIAIGLIGAGRRDLG